MRKILIYNSGGGLGDSIQLIPLILSLKNHYRRTKIFYLGAHQNHFKGKLKEYNLILENAKKEVLKIHFESKSTLDKDIQSKKVSMEKEIEKEILKIKFLKARND